MNPKNKGFARGTTTEGFTLIEILVVIGIIAVLAAIVIIAINPAKQFAQARNTQRTSNVTAILNAIGQRIADNKGVFKGTFTLGTPFTCGTLPDTPTNITTGMPANPDTESAALGCLVPTYISALPVDPSDPATPIGYTVELLDNGRVEVCAPFSDSPGSEPALPDAPDICLIR